MAPQIVDESSIPDSLRGFVRSARSPTSPDRGPATTDWAHSCNRTNRRKRYNQANPSDPHTQADMTHNIILVQTPPTVTLERNSYTPLHLSPLGQVKANRIMIFQQSTCYRMPS